MNSLKDEHHTIRVVPYVGLKDARGIAVLRPAFMGIESESSHVRRRASCREASYLPLLITRATF
jgi:hypothetical protein